MSHSTADALETFDPGLFGLWESRPLYRPDTDLGGTASRAKTLPVEGLRAEFGQDARLAADVRAVLEVKSAALPVNPADELREILNDMTAEMRAQFVTFRDMRRSAAAALEDGDEAAQKLARADVKAATDAMSLIVRTLEKVDSLQRQLARDRDIEAERLADEGGYEEAKARFVRMIEDRANETAYRLYETWKRTGPPDAIAQRLAAESAEQTDAAAEDGKARAAGRPDRIEDGS